jgi:hypothetical protein
MGAHRQHRSVPGHDPVPAGPDPQVILSSQLPAATGLGSRFLDMLAAAPETEPFVGLDQQALQHLLADFETGTTAT